MAMARLKEPSPGEQYALKDLVTGTYVEFIKYVNGDLWYGVHLDDMDWHRPGDLLFEFPVPIADVGNATFLARDKALLFMRYIRKHREMLVKAKKEQG